MTDDDADSATGDGRRERDAPAGAGEGSVDDRRARRHARAASDPGDVHVAIDGLTVEYPGGVTAVSELSLRLDRGELLVLVGPSGCGKSTTLRCLAGLESPTDGDVRIGGQSVVGTRPEARNVAMVFQNYALYPHKTARQNIGFGLRMTTDLSDAEIDARVERVAGTLGVTDLLDQRPRSLSGGQQQRVALGRAIVRDPALFLLDEPLSNLDATLRARMRTEIQELQRDLGVTTVYVTHDQTEAMTMGDRIAVLNEGRLQQVGTPLECYREPANLFVAGFVGEPSMNHLDCRLDRSGPSPRFEGAIRYPATDDLAAAAREATDGRVTLGVRPAALDVTVDDERGGRSDRGRSRPAPGADRGSVAAGTDDDRRVDRSTGDGVDADESHAFSGRVDVVEPVGEQSFLHVTLAGGASVIAATPGDAGAWEGATVHVRVPPDHLHLFDADSGVAIHHPPPTAFRGEPVADPRRRGGRSDPGDGTD
jgi:multiple sugar transport system ATP-binding protein